MRKTILLLMIIASGLVLMAQPSKVRTAGFALQSGELDKAKEAIDEAVTHEKSISDPKAWYYRGDVYIRIAGSEKYGHLDADPFPTAIESLVRCLELDSKKNHRDECLMGLGLIQGVYFEKGTKALQDHEYEAMYDAFSLTEELSGIIINYTDPEKRTTTVDSVSMFYKGYAAEMLGNGEEAKGIFQQLVDMGFSDKFLYDFYANLLIRSEEYEKALEVVRKGQALHPEDHDLVITELNIYLAQGKADEAVDRFKEAVELEPENADLRFALGTIYDRLLERAIDEGHTDKAAEYRTGLIEAYESCLEIDPTYFKAAYNLGVLYFNEAVAFAREMNNVPLREKEKYKALEKKMNEHMELAKPFLEKAHQLEPTDVSTIKALREIYLRLQDLESYNKLSKLLEEMED
jgi:tetratricopeptide (TPR) repeat protein